MAVDIEEIKRIASLARLEFSDKELQRFTTDLNQILQYVEKLNELNTDSVEPTYHPISYDNVMRPDEAGECLSVDQALRNAPEKTWQYFVVPKVIN